MVLGWIAIVALLYLVVQPVIEIVVHSFQAQPRDAFRIPELETGAWTGYYWERALDSPFSRRTFYQPLLNTLLVSLGYTVMAMALGVALAWLTVRSDLPGKRLVGALAVIPYILPSWTLALAWTTLFRHDGQVHGAQGVFQYLTGIAVPDWLSYGAVPIMIVLAVNYFAYTFLLASAAFATVDSSQEEAAELQGASRARVFRTVTLPLILPALASAFVLTFCSGLGTFGVPYVLGRPVGFDVMATYLYGNMQLGRYGDAFVLTTVLIGLAALTVYMNALVLGRRRQYTTVTGKGSHRSLVALGRWRWPLATLVGGGVAAAALGPILLLFLQSTQSVFGNYDPANFTLDYWIGRDVRGFNGVLVEPRILRAGLNTVVLGVSVGLVSVVSAFLLGYVIAKGRGTRLGRIVEQVSFLPYVIPGVAFGAIYLTLWSEPRLFVPSLYGTMALMVLATAVKRMPYAARSGTGAMLQIGRELEEAARVHGASWWTSARRVLVPLTRHGLLVGFILTFVGAAKDLTMVIMLSTPRTEVLSVVAIGFAGLAMEQFSHAIALIIIALVLFGTLLARVLAKADPTKAFGGS